MINRYHSKEGSSVLPYLTWHNKQTFPKNVHFFTYGREAIYQIMKENHIAKGDKILMPAYQCNTVIDYILPFTDNIVFYSIDKKLSFDYTEISNKLDEHVKCIFFVHYFGILPKIDEKFLQLLRKKKIIIIHDMAHSFLSLYHHKFDIDMASDYIISSIYKNIITGAGAVAIGDFHLSSGLDYKEVLIINIKKVLTHIRCMLGMRKFTYYDLYDDKSYNEPIYLSLKSTGFTKVFQWLLNHIDLDRLIIDRQKLAYSYLELFDEIESPFSNIVDKTILKDSILQAFPVHCTDKEKREKIFVYLKKHCIDVYPWPTYHHLNHFDRLKHEILLFPIEKYAFDKTKEFLYKEYT